MGMAMARNLHARGYRVWARDLREQADDEARAAGADDRDLAALCWRCRRRS